MNATSNTPLCGLVLAGGRSARMGTNKAELVHADGRTLALRVCELLGKAGCESVALSLRHDQDLPTGFGDPSLWTIVRDPVGGSRGPLSGIVAAMGLRPDADWVVLACDLPRLDLATLAHLISSKKAGESFLSYRSEFDGLPEPLCAIYAKESFSILEAASRLERSCPRKVLIQNACRLLDPVTPRALENSNTPEDWALANTP